MKWPRGALYEGDVRIPLSLWSRTSAIRDLGETDRVVESSHCRPYGPLRVIRRVLGNADTSSKDRPSSSTQSSAASGCTLTFIPHFVVRQLSSESAPVQSPTFNPQFAFSYFELTYYPDSANKTKVASGARLLNNAVLQTTHINVGHYSNGQSGCFYATQIPLPGAECIGSGGVTDLNTKDGSFSTDYFEYGTTLARLRLDDDLAETRRMSTSALYRWNPGFLGSVGGMDQQLARVYGRWSIALQTEVKQQSKFVGYRYAWDIRVGAECASRKYLPCRGSAYGALTFPALYGFGVFARYVAGSDYYNMGFATKLANGGNVGGHSIFPMLGVTIDHTRLITLTKKAATKSAGTRGR